MAEQNYKVTVDENSGEVSVTFNINENIGESKSGKSLLIASTKGNKNISDLITDLITDDIKNKFKDIKIGMNVYKALPKPNEDAKSKQGSDDAQKK
ncbi:hypothetical protein OAG24_00065 [bacterium]|nr:hypothetical protein [bacterium]